LNTVEIKLLIIILLFLIIEKLITLRSFFHALIFYPITEIIFLFNQVNFRKFGNIMLLVGFVTVNFYDEINNPQHRGMFKFFDRAFIGKPLNADFIDNLSKLPHFINDNL